MAVLIGSLTGGGASDFFGTGQIGASQWSASASGSVGQVSMTITSSAFTSLQLAIYADSGGAPAGLLGSTVTTSDTTAGTRTLAMNAPASINSGTNYWLAVFPLGGDVNFVRATIGAYSGRNGPLGSLPDPFGTLDFSGTGANIPMTGESVAIAAVSFIPHRMPLGV